MVESSFYFRQHSSLYIIPDLATLGQEWEREEIYQTHLLNVLYAITPEGVEFQYNLAASHSAISGGKNKILGLHSGWPDLQAGWPDCNGLFFLELKAKRGRVSQSQIECHAWVRQCGGKIAVTKTILEAVRHLGSWGMPIKEAYQYLAAPSPHG